MLCLCNESQILQAYPMNLFVATNASFTASCDQSKVSQGLSHALLICQPASERARC